MKNKIKLFTLVSALVIPNLFSCNAIKTNRVTLTGTDQLEVGESFTFKGEALPKEATSKQINWISSSPDVAYVDGNGNVTGVKPGKVTITAAAADKGASASKTVLIGGYVEKHVEGISISSSKDNILENEFVTLDVNITPNDADNKHVKFTSSNPDIISVDDYGVVKGEMYDASKPNQAKITATTLDGNKISEKTFTIFPNPNQLKINGFSQPNLKTKYDYRLLTSEDKIDASKINKDNSKDYVKSNFFKQDEDKSIYKVGNLNKFKFKGSITWGNDQWQDYTDYNPYQDIVMKYRDASGNFVPAGNDLYTSSNVKNNEFQFTNAAIGKIFELTISPSLSKYDGVTSEMKTTFYFKVVEGYNAYDLAGLSTVDNNSYKHALKILGPDHEVIKQNKFSDAWGEFKNKNNIPDPDDFKVNTVILHDDISITSKDLSKYVVWTDKETDDYINGVKDPIYKERFDSFVDIKANIHQDEWKDLPEYVQRAKCRYLLNGSMKDCTSIFNRITDNDKSGPFTLEGNLFTIDCSKVKPAVLFNKQTLDNYQKIATHGTDIFRINRSPENYGKVTKAGENVYDNYLPFSLYNYKSDVPACIYNLRVLGNAQRNDAKDEGMGGLTAVDVENNLTMNNCILTEVYNGAYFCTDLSTPNVVIDSCKMFNTFVSFVQMWCAKNIKIENSILKDSGGQGIIMWEDVSGGPGGGCTLYANNTYIESFLTGNEIYNKNNLAHIIIGILAAVGLNAFEKYKSLDLGPECQHRDFIKIEDGVVKVNYILFHNFSPFMNPNVPGTSKFIVDGKAVMDLEEQTKEGSIIDIYNNIDLTARTLLSFSFMSDKGGHARLPINKIAEADDLEMYDPNISPEAWSTAEQTTTLSNYQANKEHFDKDIPTVKDNLSKLFSGDYCAVYFKPLLNYMSSFVLGYK